MVLHSGSSANSGHYIAASTGVGAGVDEWVLYDDSHVKALSIESLQTMLSPECKSATTAYLLFYSRR
jgi:uncharacterized UBP type Zn finger protein